MATIGLHLLLPFGTRIGIDEALLIEFLNRLEDLYIKNPYHNSLHGLSVAHQGLVCLKAFGLHNECV